MSELTYWVVCERAEGWWRIAGEVPPRRRVEAQARRLGEVGPTARRAIAQVLDVPPDSFHLEIDVRLPDSAQALVNRAIELRHAAEVAHDAATEATAEAVRALVRGGVSMREAGQILGVVRPPGR